MLLLSYSYRFFGTPSIRSRLILSLISICSAGHVLGHATEGLRRLPDRRNFLPLALTHTIPTGSLSMEEDWQPTDADWRFIQAQDSNYWPVRTKTPPEVLIPILVRTTLTDRCLFQLPPGKTMEQCEAIYARMFQDFYETHPRVCRKSFGNMIYPILRTAGTHPRPSIAVGVRRTFRSLGTAHSESCTGIYGGHVPSRAPGQPRGKCSDSCMLTPGSSPTACYWSTHPRTLRRDRCAGMVRVIQIHNGFSSLS